MGIKDIGDTGEVAELRTLIKAKKQEINGLERKLMELETNLKGVEFDDSSTYVSDYANKEDWWESGYVDSEQATHDYVHACRKPWEVISNEFEPVDDEEGAPRYKQTPKCMPKCKLEPIIFITARRDKDGNPLNSNYGSPENEYINVLRYVEGKGWFYRSGRKKTFATRKFDPNMRDITPKPQKAPQGKVRKPSKAEQAKLEEGYVRLSEAVEVISELHGISKAAVTKAIKIRKSEITVKAGIVLMCKLAEVSQYIQEFINASDVMTNTKGELYARNKFKFEQGGITITYYASDITVSKV